MNYHVHYTTRTSACKTLSRPKTKGDNETDEAHDLAASTLANSFEHTASPMRLIHVFNAFNQ